MIKKIFCITMAILMLFCFASCNNDGIDAETTEASETSALPKNSKDDPKNNKNETEGQGLQTVTYPLNSRSWGVKTLGVRTIESDTQINCDWSCSGREINIAHYGGDITFSVGSSHSCHFKVFVDGELVKGPKIPTQYHVIDSDKDEIVLKDIPEGEHTIRLVKATGYTLARAQIYSVAFAGEILEQVNEEDKLYIEFIGSNICCGYGTVGNNTASYMDQDGTFAYPYLVAETLGADYSITALQDHGLLTGVPGIQAGYTYASPLRNSETKYAFARKADVVVINLGTEDYSASADQRKIEEFATAYMQLINTVKENNGKDCKIVCLYNAVNDNFATVLNAMLSNRQDQGIYLLKLDRALEKDPDIYAKYPTILDNRGYAAAVVDFLNDNVLK